MVIKTRSSEVSNQSGTPSQIEEFVSYNRSSRVFVDLSVSGAYAAGEIVGGLFEVHDATLGRNYDGVSVRTILVTDRDNQQAAFNLHLFDAQPTAFVDGAVYAPIDADNEKRARSIALESVDYIEEAGKAYLDVPDARANIDMRYGTQSTFFGVLVAVGAYNATLGLTLKFLAWID